MAASIASCIAQAGDKVIINKAAFFHLHRPWCLACGNAPELRGAATDLDTVAETLLNVYADRSKQPPEKIRELMKGEEGHDGTMLNSASALVYGLVDEIDETGAAAAACISPDFFDLEEGEEKPEEPETPDQSDKTGKSDKSAPKEEEKEGNTDRLADLERELENLRAKVMGVPAESKAMTWREAVNTLGYPEAKKQYPDLYAEAVRGAK